MSKRHYDYTKPRVEEPVEPIVETLEPVAEPTPEIKQGVVSGCVRLNVRSNPSLKGAVLTTLAEGDTVTIDSETGDWYKVTLGDGTNGFCMKKFIET